MRRQNQNRILPIPAPTASFDAPESVDASKSVLVGEIVASFGILGQVKMLALMDEPAALIKLPFVTLHFPSEKNRPAQQVRVLSVRKQKGAVLLSLDGVTDRNAAETLRGAHVLIAPDELPPLEPDTYYERDLLGLQVITDAGADLGPIEKVLFYPANDVYETPLALIPAVEAFIVQVDLPAKKMIVRDVPGLRKSE